MRTLAFLTALLLLALQAQSQKLEKADDQVSAQDQPGAEVQDMTISFAGDKRSARGASKGITGTATCTCRHSNSCLSHERGSGMCISKKGKAYKLCCLR
ncbi:defensin-5 precursor [Equus caballus]|uniref:Paneth cell-specific alpha-defensin 5 n=1 Tax=Equus caballus TaxID=9796 RepID=C8BNF8_HORSE|nr:defensin-5 precursor [Equus caballus]ACV49731.1 Paneth cell-specific alpha-defensin 5 [Equus caballus]